MAKLHEKQKAQKYHEEFRRKVADQLRQKKMKEREEKEHEEYQKAVEEKLHNFFISNCDFESFFDKIRPKIKNFNSKLSIFLRSK